METARNLDTQETTKEIDALVGNDNNIKSTEDIHNIHGAQSNVRDLIDNSVEFTDKDKERFKKKYDQLLNREGATDIRKINEFKQEIEDKLSWVKTKKSAYSQKLRANEKYFQDGAVDEYIDAFDKASIEGDDAVSDSREKVGKVERWEKLESEIREQARTFKEFMSLFPNKADLVHTLGKSDRQRQIDDYNKCKKNIDRCKSMLDENKDIFSDSEHEEFLDEIEDSVGESQTKLLQELKEKIKARKEASANFEKLPKEYQQLYSNFSQLSIQEKEKALKSIEEKMKADYRKRQSNHPQSKNISQTSQKQAAEFFDKLPIDKKIEALDKLDSQFEFEAPLAVSFEQNLESLKEIETPDRIEKRSREFFESDYDGKIKIIKDLEKDKECTTKYIAKLQDLLENKEIPARSVERGKKKWGDASLSDRISALDKFDSEVAEKKRTNRVFRELIKQFPPQVRQQNEDYWELNHYKRGERVAQLEKQLEELQQTPANTNSVAPVIDIKTAKPIESEADSTTADTGVNKEKVEKKAKDVMSTQTMKDKRKKVTILKTVAEEAKGSQERNHKTIKAQDKTSKIDSKDKDIAKALKQRSKDHILTQDGTTEEIVNTKFQQMDTLSTDETSKLQKSVVKNILDSPDQNSFSDNFQLKNEKGEVVDADLGVKQAEKMEKELKEDVAKKVIRENPESSNDNNDAEIIELVQKEEIDVDLRATG